ncbi:hypothetical protein E1262_27355 [Jiangella aurantiaca]|uniref:Uncharacterized protein n=1 Tax=Jiangella aurantiaca TaxID=2530373 RepID=A0A4V2YR49_9ACTN|nr:hypothetical protein [Jiangella aurantiaca]TDD64717.1 hypothetical protein E1262_27355 [Jiangella aurantiaca]
MAPGHRRLRTALLAAAAAVPLALLTGGVAQAHPFGDPQTARIGADGDTVRVTWHAADDDLSALAIELRVVESGRTFVYQDGALVPEESDPTDVDALVAAPEFADYLLKHIRVRAGGQECTGSVGSLDRLGDDGAELTFACAGPVRSAEVSISTLTDMHEAYRTLATGAGDQGHVYTPADDTAEWTFDAAAPTSAADGAGLARRALPQVVAVLAALAGAAAVMTLVVRRRRPKPAPGGVSTGAHHP